MRHTTQACLNSSDNDRSLLISMPNQVAIDYYCVIRSFIRNTSRCISVTFPVLLGYIIMVHHGIHIAGRNEEAESWLSQYCNTGIILPIRLCNDAYRVPMRLQQSGNNGMSKRWMIYVSVSTDIYKVKLFDASFFHIFFTDR